MDFKQELVELLAKNTKLKKEELSNLVVVPPDSKMGDYAFPCFKLGKKAKEEAEKLKEKLELPNFISKVEVVGPYLNFFLKPSVFAKETLTAVYKQAVNYGKGKENKKIVLEYCGPNTNKPLHLGHLRNMALGLANHNLLTFQGNTVYPVNIVNDRGIHICKSMLAYMKWGKNKQPNAEKQASGTSTRGGKKGDHFVGDFYVLFSKKAKDDEDLVNEAQEMLLKWEREDSEVIKLWKQMNAWVLAGFAETYKRFGVSFVKEYFESKYYEGGKELVYEGLKKKVFEKDHTNAIIARLEKYNLPDKVLLRGDETSIYITQDMNLAELRARDFKFNQMIYVVASEQKLHFQQLFKVLELLKKSYAKNLYHLSYGMVHLPSGRMKSREGTVIDADDLMDEVSSLAEEEIKKRHSGLSEEKVKERAELIGIGAIKFFMVKTDPVKDIVFDPKESLNFEGETGPYVQYTHARACSILRKAKKDEKLEAVSQVSFDQFSLAEELAVVRLLYDFPSVVRKAANTYKPHHLAQYLIGLSQAFNEFYHKCPVISEQIQVMKARLLLVDSVRQVLENGLGLLGIKAPEEM